MATIMYTERMPNPPHDVTAQDQAEGTGPDAHSQAVTLLLQAASAGDEEAPSQLLELVYSQLRAIAQQRMAGERRSHTLQATALVHEAYLRLLGKQDAEWTGRAHFFRAAAEAMRKILIDHARARNADKRGGGKAALTIINVADLAQEQDPSGILALDDAMVRLERVDRQAADVVRLRFYAGLSVEAAAETLEISPRTVRRDWAFARAWLRDALERDVE